MIRSIQISRGVAAVAVAIYHVYLLFFQKFGVATFEGVAKLGFLGVPYFFVLSGFIITLAHWDDLGRPERLASYGWRRFTRLYPVYWIFTAAFVFAALAGLGEAELDPRPIAMIENLLLVHFTPDFMEAPLKVAWTLFYEVRFYTLFGLAILSPRLAAAAGAVWIGACFFVTPTNGFLDELLAYWSFAFLFGMGAALAYRRLPPRHAWLVLGMGLGLCVFIFIGEPLMAYDKRSWRIFPVSGGFACVILALTLLEKTRLEAARRRIGERIGLLLGDASYSIYLVHSAVISVAMILIARLGLDRILPHALMFFPVLFAAVGAGVAAHWLVERPILAWFRNHRAQRARLG